MDCDGCISSLEEIDVGLGALGFMIIYERMEMKKVIVSVIPVLCNGVCVSDVR